eukprot:3571353-Rhodomonas_salina.3
MSGADIAYGPGMASDHSGTTPTSLCRLLRPYASVIQCLGNAMSGTGMAPISLCSGYAVSGTIIPRITLHQCYTAISGTNLVYREITTSLCAC